ncbi:MAG: magnesium and cobalt transport protein CorA [Anaerolineae bacterium]|jgi:magnesium transporter|nr:MAG: magnesium and cobalt transport protein CorA [Anaerolineae bacterium]
MIRAYLFDGEKATPSPTDIHSLQNALTRENHLLWLDFEASSPQIDEPLLREVFGFHPLAIDDALHESHIPKIDDWEQYLYIVLHAIQFEVSGETKLETLELDIFLGSNYMVTHHDRPIQALNLVWEECQQHDRHWKSGSDALLYRLIDKVVTSYLPVLDQIDQEIEQLEISVFHQPQPEIVEKIFLLKRMMAQLRRVIAPQREVLNKLARDDFAVIDRQARVYFRDIYDHLVRLHDLSESIRDLIGGTLDIYLSVINNRMNDIMKTLTIITTLFMPISFITGFFGMNFFAPVEGLLQTWTGLAFFVITLLILTLTPLVMFWWVKRRGWV